MHLANSKHLDLEHIYMYVYKKQPKLCKNIYEFTVSAVISTTLENCGIYCMCKENAPSVWQVIE